MQIKIAFYKGGGDWRNSVIRWWTKSIYSHAELILPDDYTWVSISPRLNSKVEAKVKLEHNPDMWDFVSFDITREQFETIMAFVQCTSGCRYDWFGMLLSQFTPFRIKQKGRWYCSEWISYALRISNVFDWKIIKIYEQKDLSPGRLHRLVIKQKKMNIAS